LSPRTDGLPFVAAGDGKPDDEITSALDDLRERPTAFSNKPRFGGVLFYLRRHSQGGTGSLSRHHPNAVISGGLDVADRLSSEHDTVLRNTNWFQLVFPEETPQSSLTLWMNSLSFLNAHSIVSLFGIVKR
jgi:hypothetical protein